MAIKAIKNRIDETRKLLEQVENLCEKGDYDAAYHLLDGKYGMIQSVGSAIHDAKNESLKTS